MTAFWASPRVQKTTNFRGTRGDKEGGDMMKKKATKKKAKKK